MLSRQTQQERAGTAPAAPPPGSVNGSVGTENVPASVLDLSGLSRIDYVDHFTLVRPVGGDGTPEQWARAMFGDTPDVIERLLWGGILRLTLSRGISRDTVAGWQVAERGETWTRLAAASRSVSAELIVQADASHLGLVTLVRFDRRAGRLTWLPTAALHRKLVPALLRSTARAGVT